MRNRHGGREDKIPGLHLLAIGGLIGRALTDDDCMICTKKRTEFQQNADL